jgi:hypothetical protein
MNRRNFLSLMVGGVAVAAARSFPFRVFSFPKEVKPLNAHHLPKEIMEALKQRLDLINQLGTDEGSRFFMHPKQLAKLKELVYGYPRIELREVEGPAPDMVFGSSPTTLFQIPIRECVYLDPEAPPVLLPMPYFPVRSLRGHFAVPHTSRNSNPSNLAFDKSGL